jgi:hypothetical protein
MNEPIAVPDTSPSNHKMSRMTAMVYNMVLVDYKILVNK